MERINVGFDDKVIEKLRARTKTKMCNSIAHSIRELVDLGLKIEEAAGQNDETNNEADSLNFLTNIIKNNIRWTLESLLIVRQLTEKISNNDDEITRKCKEQALAHIRKMFSDEGEIN